jgi:hypothetical protein
MGDTGDEPTPAELRIFAACDDGGFGSLTAVELVKVANVFDDFGCPLVSSSTRCGHLTWTVAGVTVTISLSDGGLCGVSVIDDMLPNLCWIGHYREPGDLVTFRTLCMAAKGALLSSLIWVAEQMQRKGD